MGLQNNGAPSRKNQAGSASRPVAVGRRVSSALKTSHSDM